jgi:hypothetical protein
MACRVDPQSKAPVCRASRTGNSPNGLRVRWRRRLSERVEGDLKLTRLPRTVQPITPSNLFAVAAASPNGRHLQRAGGPAAAGLRPIHDARSGVNLGSIISETSGGAADEPNDQVG